MRDEEPFDEFCEDFGTEPLTEQGLQALLNRARESNDRDLRLAIKQLQALRWLSSVLLERVERTEPEAADSVIQTARFMIRGEGGIGNVRV